jgi:DNA polymerase
VPPPRQPVTIEDVTRSLLHWAVQSGDADCVDDQPRNRFASRSDARPAVLAPAPAAAASGSGTAASATSLAHLRQILEGFEACPLSRTATNLVFADGSEQAAVVMVGEAPGAEEDRLGRPFVGPSGRLLDRMLASIGLDRTQVLITNTVFWRPPGNRSPTSSEIATCLPFVERLIEIVAPRIIITLGGPAAMALLGVQESVGRLRGRWFSYQTATMIRPIPATALFHPAYLLRSPSQKRLAWRDLLAIRTRLFSG